MIVITLKSLKPLLCFVSVRSELVSLNKEQVDILIGERVEDLRKTLQLSRGDLGHALNIKEQMVGKKLRGQAGFTAAQLVQLAYLFKVDPTIFLKDLDENLEIDHQSVLLNFMLDSVPLKQRKYLEQVRLLLEGMELE